MNVLIVGTYTTRDAPAIAGDQELGRGIYLFPYDGESGEAGEAAVIAEAENPSWVCVAGGRMFAVSERADSAVLLEYELCKSGQEEVCVSKTGELHMKGSASCHIEKDAKRRRLYLSDYGSGDLKVIDIAKPGDPVLIQQLSFEGNGPNRERQEASHIHSGRLIGDELYVADLGNDSIYLFDVSKERISKRRTLRTKPGAGPRHMQAIDKAGNRILYVVNELNCTLSVYRDDEEIQTLPLSEWQGGQGELAADLVLSENGFLYASVRGTGEIRSFGIGADGTIEALQTVRISDAAQAGVQAGGIRSICLDQAEKHLIAADQRSGTLAVFDRQGDGTLTGGRILREVPAPVKVMTAEVNAV